MGGRDLQERSTGLPEVFVKRGASTRPITALPLCTPCHAASMPAAGPARRPALLQQLLADVPARTPALQRLQRELLRRGVPGTGLGEAPPPLQRRGRRQAAWPQPRPEAAAAVDRKAVPSLAGVGSASAGGGRGSGAWEPVGRAREPRRGPRACGGLRASGPAPGRLCPAVPAVRDGMVRGRDA